MTVKNERHVLLSIQPNYARMIFEGTKRVELRRIFPLVEIEQWVIVYVSSPVKAIWGAFEIDRVLQAKTCCLWQQVKKSAGINKSDFDLYYSGAEFGYGIFINKFHLYKAPISLNALRNSTFNLSPPQNFRYLNSTQASYFDLLNFEA